MMSTNGASRSASGTATVSVASGWRTRRPWALRTDSVAEHTSRTWSIVVDQLVVGRQLVGAGPVAQVHAAGTPRPAVEPVVDLLGDERQQRRGDAHDDVEHGVQGVDGVVVAVPEALPAAADVPVGEHVDERPDPGAGAEQVVGVHRRRHLLDEPAGLGEHVAVEHVVRRLVGARALPWCPATLA